jgi:hypothetical protein
MLIALSEIFWLAQEGVLTTGEGWPVRTGKSNTLTPMSYRFCRVKTELLPLFLVIFLRAQF